MGQLLQMSTRVASGPGRCTNWHGDRRPRPHNGEALVECVLIELGFRPQYEAREYPLTIEGRPAMLRPDFYCPATAWAPAFLVEVTSGSPKKLRRKRGWGRGLTARYGIPVLVVGRNLLHQLQPAAPDGSLDSEPLRRLIDELLAPYAVKRPA
jgi:hypothetical protein